MSTPTPRLVLFGATGHLGLEVLDVVGDAALPVGEILGVASPDGAGADFDYREEVHTATSAWPTLRAGDLVVVCTPAEVAPEVVRAALRAEAPCLDCSGALAAQEGVLVPLGKDAATWTESSAAAPLASLPSATLLAWAPILEALAETPGLDRVVATVLRGASGQGRDGLVALSEESIALFNQSDPPAPGPAGQGVAFDVVPGGGDEAVLAAQAARCFPDGPSIAAGVLQVPAFVGEGAQLHLETRNPIAAAEILALLEAAAGLEVVAGGPGSRGLVAVPAVEEDGAAPAGPFGPTLRDGVGRSDVLVGQLRADPSTAPGRGWQLFASYDPARRTAFRVAAWLRARLLGA